MVQRVAVALNDRFISFPFKLQQIFAVHLYLRVTISRHTAGSEKESEAHFERGRRNPDPDTDAAAGCQVRKDSRRQEKSKDI